MPTSCVTPATAISPRWRAEAALRLNPVKMPGFLRHRAARPPMGESLFYARVRWPAHDSGGGVAVLPATRRNRFSKVNPVASTTSPEPTRRDFIYVATASVAAVGAAVA